MAKTNNNTLNKSIIRLTALKSGHTKSARITREHRGEKHKPQTVTTKRGYI